MAAPIIQTKITSNADLLREITETLREIGCCPRCILRYIGERQGDVYRLTTQEIEKMVESILKKENVFPLTTPCPVCLGILQAYIDEEFLQKIKNAVEKDDYEFKTFICSLTIPVCILVREHSVLIHLQDKFKDEYEIMTLPDFVSIKEAWKLRCGPLLSNLINVPFDQKSMFDIAVLFNYERSDKECSFLSDEKPDIFIKRKSKNFRNLDETFTRNNVIKALDSMSEDLFKRLYKTPPSPPKSSCNFLDIKCSHEPVFVAGRYNKYSRELSQTPWFIEGKRKGVSSVEEEICNLIKKTFRYEEGRFSASGREDVDVRMLGSGRPFVVEMINPRKITVTEEEMILLQQEINKNSTDVKVQDLQIVSKEETNNLKEGEMEKTKCYSALCWAAEPLTADKLLKLDSIKDLVMQQKTPIRVLHRRPLATRERTIHSMSAKLQDDHHFILLLNTQAGTYIKEFVHGDFGRSTPNMCTLLDMECDILTLDVESVELEWPKRLEYNHTNDEH
ncbi:tRNA pseudouridine synthase Pus10-like isoform X2 [Mytilus trossulus]|uniref:tRNA pseudouridine synthase Pus10-like isoform X1 n=1 Tax=Mytilus trossulus TaxID=6551 RepID=UPI0030065FF1